MSNVERLHSDEKWAEVVDRMRNLTEHGGPPHNGGDGGGDDMERRVAKLESSVDAILAGLTDIRTTQAQMLERMSGTNQRLDAATKSVDQRLDDVKKSVDRLPTQWDMAKIVFYVVGALMAAAIWGPRAISLLSNANP